MKQKRHTNNTTILQNSIIWECKVQKENRVALFTFNNEINVFKNLQMFNEVRVRKYSYGVTIVDRISCYCRQTVLNHVKPRLTYTKCVLVTNWKCIAFHTPLYFTCTFGSKNNYLVSYLQDVQIYGVDVQIYGVDEQIYGVDAHHNVKCPLLLSAVNQQMACIKKLFENSVSSLRKCICQFSRCNVQAFRT
jgi:hypothetical protein